MKKREVYKVVLSEVAKKRIAKKKCPVCGKPKPWPGRHYNWTCCSTECTAKFYSEHCTIYDWKAIRKKAFIRDNHTCIKCEKSARKFDSGRPDDSYLIGDHIKPIALGGEEFDLDNVQTLCIPCNKVKTRHDMKAIAALRRHEKLKAMGQRRLDEFFSNRKS